MSTNKSYLPTGKGLEDFKREYPTASRERLEELAVKYGYKGVANLITAMKRHHGIGRARAGLRVRRVYRGLI